MIYIQVINACFYTGDRIQILSQYFYIHNNTVFFFWKKALNWSCMLGIPEELVQAYITVLLQYKKGLTLGSKGIR